MHKSGEEQQMNRILIGVAGGSAAGKTTLCQTIRKTMAIDGNFKVVVISLDAFYKSLDTEKVDVSGFNFDHPHALDFDMALEVLKGLLQGKNVALPKYCFKTYKRLSEVEQVSPTEIIMFEGFLALYDERIRELMKYKIFIHCDGNSTDIADDVRLCRRLKRDVAERGRTIEGVLLQYHRFVKSSYKDFIYPTIRYADLIVPGSRNNRVSIDFIVKHMKNLSRESKIYRRAIKTKVYFYGDVLDTFLKEGTSEEGALVDLADQVTEFVFACTEQHKKELDLFMGQLISEPFTLEYFHDVFINQFVRVLCHFLKRVVTSMYLKSLNEIEIVPNGELGKDQDDSKPFKVLLIPYLHSRNHSEVVQFYEKLPKQCHLIVLNMFCYHATLKKLTNLKHCTVVNLYCIASESRFAEVIQSNLLTEEEIGADFFESRGLLRKAEQAIRENLKQT